MTVYKFQKYTAKNDESIDKAQLMSGQHTEHNNHYTNIAWNVKLAGDEVKAGYFEEWEWKVAVLR